MWVKIATAPVKVASRAVELATTSQSEPDERRGRAAQARGQLGKLERTDARQRAQCDEGSEGDCEQVCATHAEFQKILPTVPSEPR